MGAFFQSINDINENFYFPLFVWVMAFNEVAAVILRAAPIGTTARFGNLVTAQCYDLTRRPKDGGANLSGEIRRPKGCGFGHVHPIFVVIRGNLVAPKKDLDKAPDVLLTCSPCGGVDENIPKGKRVPYILAMLIESFLGVLYYKLKRQVVSIYLRDEAATGLTFPVLYPGLTDFLSGICGN